MKKILVWFAAGCVGGLCASLIFGLLGYVGIDRYIQFPHFHVFREGWLYPKILWGGVYALLLLLPVLASKLWLKAMLLAVLVTVVHLFIALPFSVYSSAAGLSIGLSALLFAFIFYCLWASISLLTAKLA